MTSFTRLDDRQCQALSGGSGMRPIYKSKGCRPKRLSYHVSTKHVSKASTNLAQGNYASNTALGLGHLVGFANAESFQSNVASIITMAG
ncbi:MAG: hypothetical protein KFB97_09415 [Cyanobium sp. M30B3]|nr:MAG: hypothetical protein KFB97_09415 [Cyanobium sp. M30B3]